MGCLATGLPAQSPSEVRDGCVVCGADDDGRVVLAEVDIANAVVLVVGASVSAGKRLLGAGFLGRQTLMIDARSPRAACNFGYGSAGPAPRRGKTVPGSGVGNGGALEVGRHLATQLPP